MTLFYYPLPLSLMQQSGSSLLRSLQNEALSNIDLLIRESIQNSLDAIPTNQDHCHIDFSILEHSSNPFKELTPEISQNLKRIPKKNQLLVIKETGTIGLTGNLSLMGANPKNYGHLCKLIYSIAKPQEKVNAGGSWGIGKTIFYRFGIGLVIFYSRISATEERLALCMIENEQNPQRFNLHAELGVAWWGDVIYDQDQKAWPKACTDSVKIKEILKKLKLKPYPENQTGTQIIIPFFKTNDSSLHTTQHAMHEIDQIEMAIQRWYATRLNQPNPIGQYFKATVNGKEIVKNEFFQIYSDLYYASQNLKYSSKYQMTMRPIQLNQTFENQSTMGRLIYTCLKKETLLKTVKLTESEYAQLLFNKKMDRLPNLIFTYMRQVGLFLSWDNEDWTANPYLDSDMILMALFVPHQDKRFNEKKRLELKCEYLEEYLRSIEKSDHASWQDRSNQDMISRLKQQVRAYLQRVIKESILPQDQNQQISMNRFLTNAFWPNLYEHQSKLSNQPKSSKSEIFNQDYPTLELHKQLSPSNHHLISLVNPLNPNLLEYRFCLSWGNSYDKHIMTIEMIGENTHVSISSMKELGLKMPFQFHLFKIEKIKYKSKVEQQVSKEWNMLNTSDEQNNIKVIFSEDKIELINLNDASQEISKITEIKGVIIIHVAPNPLLLQPQIDLSSE